MDIYLKVLLAVAGFFLFWAVMYLGDYCCRLEDPDSVQQEVLEDE